MMIRNVSYLMLIHKDFDQAHQFLEKFKTVGQSGWNLNIGIEYELLRANLYEAEGRLDRCVEILEAVVMTKKRFDKPEKTKIYEIELEKIREIMKKRPI